MVSVGRYTDWLPVTGNPTPSVPISELSHASKEWAEEHGPRSRTLSKEEMEMPATQEQCRLIAESVWRHEFQVQGLIRHVEVLMSSEETASVQFVNSLSARVSEQMDAIEFRQTQQDIVMNKLSGVLDLSVRHDQQEQRLNALSEAMQSYSAQHDEHLTRLDALSQTLKEKHRFATSKSQEDMLARSKTRQWIDDLQTNLTHRLDNLATEVQQLNQRRVSLETDDMRKSLDSEEAIEEAFADPGSSEEVASSHKPVPCKDAAFQHDALDIFVPAYTLQESVWDVIVFAGFPSVGFGHSALILFTGIVNLSTQCLFCLIITTNMTTNDFTDDVVDTFMQWRLTDGHDASRSYNLANPLVAQVCGKNIGGLTAAKRHLDIHNDITSFLTNPTSSLFTGRVSAILCTMVWFFAIMKDVLHAVKYCVALLSLKRGAAKIGKHDHGSFEIRSLNYWQVAFILVISVIPRITNDALLLVSGIYFLGYTQELTELLLNAVALVFVLDLDELLFVVLVPMRVKNIMERVKSFSKSKDHPCINEWIGGARFIFTWISVSVTVLTLVHFYHLKPFHERLLKIDAYLCEGNLNFEYVVNQATGIVTYSSTEPWSNANAKVNTYQTQAVWDLTGLDGLVSRGAAPRATAVLVPTMELILEHSRSAEESVSYMACEDQASPDEQTWRPTWFNAYVDVLRWETQDFDIQYCPDVKRDACQRAPLHGGISKVCAICMRTCGCDNPWSGLFDLSGCSHNCDSQVERRLTSFVGAPPLIREYLDNCSDPPNDLLAQDNDWQNYATQVRTIFALLFSESLSARAYDQMLTRGCQGASTPLRYESNNVSLCYTGNVFTWPARSVRMWCPESCRCKQETVRQREKEGRECPTKCVGQ